MTEHWHGQKKTKFIAKLQKQIHAIDGPDRNVLAPDVLAVFAPLLLHQEKLA